MADDAASQHRSTATAPTATAGGPVTVAVEITVTGADAVTLGAEIADQLRALAIALAEQSRSADVAVSAALVLGGGRPVLDQPVLDEPSLDTARLRINCGQRTIRLDDEAIDLTRREFDLLVYLARQPGRVFTRPQLLHAVWGHAHISGERTVDVHVRRIRAKLHAYESLIVTVRGVGYRLAAAGLAEVVE